MPRNIREGDKVKIIWSDDVTSYVEGIVENVPAPADVGDLWYIRSGKTLRAINPCNIYFDMIVKEEKE